MHQMNTCMHQTNTWCMTGLFRRKRHTGALGIHTYIHNHTYVQEPWEYIHKYIHNHTYIQEPWEEIYTFGDIVKRKSFDKHVVDSYKVDPSWSQRNGGRMHVADLGCDAPRKAIRYACILMHVLIHAHLRMHVCDVSAYVFVCIRVFIWIHILCVHEHV
jgi:hypothetical protein